ncbi:MAG: SDR family oxidoreductase, partial [Actinobacteria bacterium]|nr:SDR family oxidoreductase [Actinomycetota bacterium]
MPDLYQQLVNSPVGKQVTSLLGLPRPTELRRYEPGDPLLPGTALVGGPVDGRLEKTVTGILQAADVDLRVGMPSEGTEGRYAALVFDATGIHSSADLASLHAFFHPTVAKVEPSGRVVVLGTPPEECADPGEAAAQQALEGFVRSLAKELRGGATANLVKVSEGAEEGLESTLRFLLSGRSAYVSGQAVQIGPATDESPAAVSDWDRPLDGQVAVVTGAARGIGASIAATLARDGATVVCLDLPAQGDQLTEVANRIGGTTLQLDITADDAPGRLASYLTDRHGGVDVMVHNAGVTRDKTIVGMDE